MFNLIENKVQFDRFHPFKSSSKKTLKKTAKKINFLAN